MDWMTEKTISKAKRVLETDPVNKRQAIAGHLGITEYKAREILREIENEPVKIEGPTWAVFDIETTKLEGHFGRLLCGSVLSYPSMEIKTYRWDDYSPDPSEDADLAVAIRDAIESHTISCGYFTKGFDIGFLNARLAAGDHRTMRSMPHLDAIWAYRGWRGLKIGSSSMKNVAEFLGLDEQKMDVPKIVWVKANSGNVEALDVLIDRCESDVRVTWKIAQHVLDNRLLKNPIQMYP